MTFTHSFQLSLSSRRSQYSTSVGCTHWYGLTSSLWVCGRFAELTPQVIDSVNCSWSRLDVVVVEYESLLTYPLSLAIQRPDTFQWPDTLQSPQARPDTLHRLRVESTLRNSVVQVTYSFVCSCVILFRLLGSRQIYRLESHGEGSISLPMLDG